MFMMMFFNMLMLFVVCCIFDTTTAMWTPMPSSTASPPSRRLPGMGYDAINNVVYVFGGQLNGGFLNDLWAYNVSTAVWSEITTAIRPEGRFSMVYGSSNTDFIISTGEGRSKKFFDDAWGFNFVRQEWEKIETTGTPPEKRYGAGGGVAQNTLYVTHGFSATRYSNMFSLNLSTKEWTEIYGETSSYTPGTPHGRCLVGSDVNTAGQVAFFGGCLTGGGAGGPCPSHDSWVYKDNDWYQGNTCSSPRMHSAMAAIPRSPNFVLYGGLDRSDQILSMTPYEENEIAILDPDTVKWTKYKVSGMSPSKRHGHVMHSGVDGVFMFGGNVNDQQLWHLNLTDESQRTKISCGFTWFSWPMLHALFMVLSWGGLLQAGAFIARYFRHRNPWWFKMHRGLQGVGLLFALIGFVFAFYSTQFGHLEFAHGQLGVVIIVLGLTQPIGALFRPHPGTPNRKYFNFFHLIFGRTALFLGMVNISLGLYLYLAPVAWQVLWFMAFAFLIIMYLVFEYRKRTTDKKANDPPEKPSAASDVQMVNIP